MPSGKRNGFSVMDDLDQLYQDILMDHYKHPRNREVLCDDEVLADEENPLCGDQIRISARLQDGRIAEIRFDGKGCAISQASASMMTETLKGKTVEEAHTLIEQFIRAMRGERDFADDLPDDVRALNGVRKYPIRIKCATMSWRSMRHALAKLSP